MKKHQLLKKTIAIIFISFLFTITLFIYKYDALLGSCAVRNVSELPSATAKENCHLCGNRNTPMQCYIGQTNLGYLNLNTFEFTLIELQSYNEQGFPISDKQQNLTLRSLSNESYGSKFQVSSMPDYHIAVGEIILNKNSRLDLEQTSKFLCTDCLSQLTSQIENSFSLDGALDCALIDLKSKEIYCINPSVRGSFFNQYYISSNYEKNYDKLKPEIGTIHLNITLSPS